MVGNGETATRWQQRFWVLWIPREIMAIASAPSTKGSSPEVRGGFKNRIPMP